MWCQALILILKLVDFFFFLKRGGRLVLVNLNMCIFFKKLEFVPLYCCFQVFWLNIAKFRVYLHYRHCSKLYRELRRESEFRQWCCRNSTKVWERKRKSGWEKILNFSNHITEIPIAQTCWSKTNCGNAIAEIGKKRICGNCGNAIAKNGRKKNKIK